MTRTGILTALLTSINVPSDGVNPPSDRAAFNSMRPAPPRSAATASSTEPTAISSRMLRGVRDMTSKFSRHGEPIIQLLLPKGSPVGGLYHDALRLPD